MKVVIAFALLAIAAQAATPAYFLGFTEQIGLDSEQMNHGSVCFDTVRQVMSDVHHLTFSKKIDVFEVLRTTLGLIDDVEHKLKADCSVYMNDITSTFFRNYQGGDLKEVAKRNWNEYTAEIIQQIAMYFDFVAARMDYEAGKTEAYIYQILLGLEKPKVLPLPVFDPSRHVKNSMDQDITDMTKSFYETLGLYDSKGIKDNIDCTFAQVYMSANMATIQGMLNEAHTTSQKLYAYERLIEEAIKVYDVCFDAYAFQFEYVVLPILKAFKVAPVHATLAVVHNYALNLPEMKQNAFQMMVDAQEGRAADFGRRQAELLLTVFSNIYPNH